MEDPKLKEQEGAKSWLEELASKSWSLEMSISGLATFGVSFLPGLIEKGLDFYLENYALGNDKTAIMMPILAYSFFKIMAFVLIGTFVLHLAMRALWVGAVGLHSAFPHGIQYSKLYAVSEAYKELAEKHFGSLESYIRKLDNRCNRLFALAFLMAMVMAGIGLIYLLFFIGGTIVRVLFSRELASQLLAVLLSVLMISAISMVILQQLSRKMPNRKRLGRIAAKAQLYFSSNLIPFFGRPVQYLSLTFMSNVPKSRYIGSMAIVVVLMVFFSVFFMVNKLMEIRGGGALEPRTFYSNRTPEFRFDPRAYDVLRKEGEKLPALSIESDVLDVPYLKVFMRYPKSLDADLAKYRRRAKKKDVPEGGRVNHFLDSTARRSLQALLELRINDSVYQEPKWYFSSKDGLKGIKSYIDARHLPPGEHTLSLRLKKSGEKGKPRTIGAIPFWIADREEMPEKAVE